MENAGLSLDRYGLPHIPGSAVKGCARRASRSPGAKLKKLEMRVSRRQNPQHWVDLASLCAYHILIMATMTIRTTVAFDPATVARWERLTKRWGTSKSETLRRALEAAEREISPAEKGSEPDFTGMSPLEIMDWLAANPQVPPGWGEEFRKELRDQREVDAEIEEEREIRRHAGRFPTGDPDL